MKLTILQGDVFERIAQIPDSSIDLAITSPPYWGLRSYGGGQRELGQEPSMEAYLDHTMQWVNEVWRVLKPTGSFVLNIGDCFYGSWGGSYDRKLKLKGNAETQPYGALGLKSPERTARYYKPKQLLSVSSFAYCKIVSETDFVCRNEDIWCKPNVPSPIVSRKKHSHEKLFWFVKDADNNYFDKQPWMKKITLQSEARNKYGDKPRVFIEGTGQKTGQFAGGPRRKKTETLATILDTSETSCFREGYDRNKYIRTNEEQLRYMREKAGGQAKLETSEEFRKKHQGTAFPTGSFHYTGREKDSPHTDQLHNVGATSCFKGGQGENWKSLPEVMAHSWRIVPVGAKQTGFELNGKLVSEHVAPYPEELIRPYIQSLCPHNGVVLDVFLGSGTTMRVAMEQGRDCIGIELNPKSIAYAKKRLNWGSGLNVEYSEKL